MVDTGEQTLAHALELLRAFKQEFAEEKRRSGSNLVVLQEAIDRTENTITQLRAQLKQHVSDR